MRKIIKIGINLFVWECEKEDNINIYTNPNGDGNNNNNVILPPHIRWVISQYIVNIILQYLRRRNQNPVSIPIDVIDYSYENQFIFWFVYFSVNIIMYYLVENENKLEKEKKEEGDEEEFDS